MNYKLFFLALLGLQACQNSTENTKETLTDSTETVVFDAEAAKSKFSEFSTFSESEQDTLLTDLTTYIFRKPSSATWETKFNPEFRPYFIENTYNLEMVYMHRLDDSTFYYYLLRDARDNKGLAQRGVLGSFKMNTENKLYEFEEICNTPIQSKDSLVQNGFSLMEELVKNGNVNIALKDKKLVEWPDGTLFYSTKKYEWRSVE